jgi:hypothetical protein
MQQLLRKILGPLEIICLGGTFLGFALAQAEVLMISVSGLAGVYFNTGFLPPVPGEQKDNEQPRGFLDLFINSICVKISWIGCSVVLIGALFRILHLNGGADMLTIGLLVLGVTIIAVGIYTVTRPDGSKLFPVLYRSVPVCLFGLYFLTTTPA